MYEIRSGSKQINGKRIDTFERNIAGDNSCMEIEAGTNGICGGNRSAGGRTYFRLSALTKSDFFARVKEDEEGRTSSVEIVFCGDDGLRAFMTAMEFAYDAISDRITGENP